MKQPKKQSNKVRKRRTKYEEFRDPASRHPMMLRCGRPRRRDGQPCRLKAGYKTGHVGEGACWLHGGRGGKLKHGLHSQYTPTKIALRAEELVGNPRILEIERQIAVAQALQERILSIAGDEPDTEAIDACLRVVRQVSADIRTYWELMLRREETIPKQAFVELLKLVFAILGRYVEDEETIGHIRRDVVRHIAPAGAGRGGGGDLG